MRLSSSPTATARRSGTSEESRVHCRVRVLAADGTLLVRTEPLLAASVADPALLAPVQLVVDAEHAYLSDPAAGAVHEIDHTDGIVTRTFADLDPRFLSQVG